MKGESPSDNSPSKAILQRKSQIVEYQYLAILTLFQVGHGTSEGTDWRSAVSYNLLSFLPIVHQYLLSSLLSSASFTKELPKAVRFTTQFHFHNLLQFAGIISSILFLSGLSLTHQPQINCRLQMSNMERIKAYLLLIRTSIITFAVCSFNLVLQELIKFR